MKSKIGFPKTKVKPLNFRMSPKETKKLVKSGVHLAVGMAALGVVVGALKK